jgi:hypothetical protein
MRATVDQTKAQLEYLAFARGQQLERPIDAGPEGRSIHPLLAVLFMTVVVDGD